MRSIFNYENRFFVISGKIVDCVWVSILWLVFSLPVITVGASTTACYYTVHKSLRGDRGYIWSCFWSAFKSNFKQTTKIWLVLLAAFGILFLDGQITFGYLKQGSPFGVLYYIFYFLLFFWLVYSIYVFAFSARFENGMKETMKNAGILALLHLPWSVAVLAVLVAASVLVYRSPVTVIIVPAAVACLLDMCLERVFRRHMSAEDLQAQKELDWEKR